MEHSSDQLIDAFFKKNTHKSDQQLSNLINALFQSPTTLLNHIHSLNEERGYHSGLSISQIFKLYQNISNFKKDNDLLILFSKTLNELVSQGTFKTYLKSSEEMKYFFIVILWDKLFKIKHYELITTRVLEYIQRAPQYKDVFSNWCQDLPADYIRLIITFVHAQLETHCKSLQEKEQTQQSNRQTSRKCQTFCYFLKLLYTSNKNKPRVLIKEFNSPFLNSFFPQVQIFRNYITKSADFNFVIYPFLFDFEYKYKLMQIESIYQQKMNIKKSMERGFSAILQSFDYNGNLSIEGLIYLYIPVNRNNILDDSMQKLGKVKQNLKSPLRIEFIGEQGTDEGGVKNQYFSLITKSIFNPYLDMFIPKNKGIYHWFNGFSYEMPLRFEFVGMLLGLALYNSVHLDIHFPEIVYKKLLNKKYEEDHGLQIIEDLKEIQPDVYRTLKDILAATQPLQELQLYFNIQLESFGQIIIQQLVQGGTSIQLSLDNREEYCLLYADFILNRHIQKQFIPFRKGFYKVVSGGIIDTFQAEELRMLINGKQEINIKQLEQCTSYQGGYTPQTPIIRHFWQFLYTLNQEEKKNFMTFITGTDRVPIEGLKALKFNIQRHSNISNLPTAHTCFNVMLLPEYPSNEILIKNMRLALQHNQGFGLI